MKRLIQILVALIVLAIIAFAVIKFMPQHTTDQNQAADFSTNPSSLYSEFESNESSASKKYIGKTIELKGFLVEKDTDESDAPVVLLSDQAGGDPIIFCTLEASEKGKFATLQSGQQLTIKGQCTGMLMEVVMNKGIIVQ